MLLISGNRGSGKTTKAIKLAYHTNSTLIVSHNHECEQVEKKALDMGMPINVISIQDFLNNNPRARKMPNNIVIDELEHILKIMLSCHNTSVNIIGASESGMNIQL